MAVKLGIFVVPDAIDPAATLAQITAGDQSDLDLVGVQDHPYQRRFFDTWTLLSFVAARTGGISSSLTWPTCPCARRRCSRRRPPRSTC